MTSATDNNAHSLKALAQSGQALIESLVSELPVSGLDPATLFAALTATPEARERLASLQSNYYRDWLALWADGAPGSGAETDNDPRFEAPEWRESHWFRLLRGAYELNSRYLTGLAEVAALDPAAKRRLRFVARQLADAMAPSNYPATNPVAVKSAIASHGETFARGLAQLNRDLARGRISMSDESAFEVGRNLAITPGDVIFENEATQLIRYRPTTREVYERPLFIVPPFINKYYILDLQPENSFVRYCVERGVETYIVSWRNIPQELGRLTWDDYIAMGVFEPLGAVRETSGSLTVNALGFCVGGTLLASALAVLAAKRHRPVASLTLLASMLEFSDTGEIGVYVDPSYVERCEREFAAGGLVPGSRLAATFATLRANELVWHFVVNNYLLGRDPKAFDLLYWNADGSNLPGPLYAYYLRNMYLENNLRVAGKLRMQGAAVDLGKIRLPAYVFAARQDHIVPWHTAYHSARLLGARTEFVLGASGHVAGVINPMRQNRRQHWTNSELPADPEAWLSAAQQHHGSWWSHWSAWLEPQSGDRKLALSTGHGRYRPIEPAPGRYVRERR
ncbi:MAG: PHA/PHB synthase family protein [Burkholderiales bacterium]